MQCLLGHWNDVADNQNDGEDLSGPCDAAYAACMQDADYDMNDTDDLFKCLVIQANMNDNVRCGGMLTKGDDQNKGDPRIGMNCLPDIALCSLQHDSVMAIFDDCLIPAVDLGTATDKCLAIFAKIHEEMGEKADDDHMSQLQAQAQSMCMEAGAKCMREMNIAGIDSIPEEEEFPMMKCAVDNSNKDDCKRMMRQLMIGTECAREIVDHQRGSAAQDKELLECINAGGAEGMFLKSYNGEFNDFLLYCSRLRSEERCVACSGKMQNGQCSAPNSENKVKCNRVVNMDICAALGCDVRGDNRCRGNPSFGKNQ